MVVVGAGEEVWFTAVTMAGILSALVEPSARGAGRW